MSTNLPATPRRSGRSKIACEELDAGALGIGMGIQYLPGATRLRSHSNVPVGGASRHVPVFTHVRSAGRKEPGSSIEAIEEVIGPAACPAPRYRSCTSTPVVWRCSGVSHPWSRAQVRVGLDMTTEAYPYMAGMTEINSALFDPGWRKSSASATTR